MIYRRYYSDFEMSPPDLSICDEIEADIVKHETMWSLFDEFNSGKNI